jgi:hypothetical protein
MRYRSTVLLAGLLLAGLFSAPAVADGGNGDWHKLRTKLYGDAVVHGKAEYRERLKFGEPERRFKLNIEDAEPGESFDVLLNGQHLATVTADAEGSVHYHLRSPGWPEGEEEDGHGTMPDDFPVIQPGDAIAVGHLGGMFAAAEDRKWDKYRAWLAGAPDVHAKADYRERIKHGMLERRFKVTIEGGEPGEMFDVYVNGELVGDVTANAAGEVCWQLRTPEFIDDDDDDDCDLEPMPDDFPRIEREDTVEVGSLSGIFYDAGREARGEKQVYKLELAGDGSMEDGPELDVSYKERLRWGTLIRKFVVEVEDAQPGDVCEVLVNGAYVGAMVIGADGEGELELRSPEAIEDADDGDPLPADFPGLMPGDEVSACGITGALERDD